MFCLLLACTVLACVSGVPIDGDLKDQILGYHNDARRDVRQGTAVGINGVLPKPKVMEDLEWDEDLADTASQWAEECGIWNGKKQEYCFHSPDAWQPSPTLQQLGFTPSVGECLGCPAINQAFPGDGQWLVQMWVNDGMINNELKKYKYGVQGEGCWIADENRWGWYDCGHYTQIIWADTQKVGCGYANCNSGHKGAFLACHYWPPGNYAQYPYEVKDLSQHPDFEQCIEISRMASDSEGESYNGQWKLTGTIGASGLYTKTGLSDHWLCYDTWRKFWCITESVINDHCNCGGNYRWAMCTKNQQNDGSYAQTNGDILTCDNKWKVYTSDSSGETNDNSVTVSSCGGSTPTPPPTNPTPAPTPSSGTSDNCLQVSGLPDDRSYKGKKLSNLNGQWVWDGATLWRKGSGKMGWTLAGKWRVGGSFNAWGWCTNADIFSCDGLWQYKKYNSAGNVVTAVVQSARFARCGALEVEAQYPCYDNYATRLRFHVNGSHSHEFERVELAGCHNDAPQWAAEQSDSSTLMLMRGEGWQIVEDEWSPYPQYVCYEEQLVDCVEGAWRQVFVSELESDAGSDHGNTTNTTLSVGGAVAYQTAYVVLSAATLVSVESDTVDANSKTALGATSVVAIVLALMVVVSVIVIGVCYFKRKRKETRKQMEAVANEEQDDEAFHAVTTADVQCSI